MQNLLFTKIVTLIAASVSLASSPLLAQNALAPFDRLDDVQPAPFLEYIVDEDFDILSILPEIDAELINDAVTYNELKVAHQLTEITHHTHAIDEILRHLLSVPIEKTQKALSQLSAEPYTNIILNAELANRQFLRLLYDPLRSIITTNPCKQVCGCSYVQPFDTWLAVSGGRAFIDGNQNARGFRLSNFEICGGVQLPISRRLTAGIALSYERGSVNYKVGGSGRVNTTLAAIYALYRNKQFYILADGTYGYGIHKVRRSIHIDNLSYSPRGTPKVYQGSVYTEIGTDFAFNNTLIQPFLGIEWGHYRFNGFRESDGNPLNVRVSNKSQSNAYSRLGVHITTPPIRCGFSMGLDLAWQYRLSSLGNNITVQFLDFGSSFNVKGLPLNRNSYEGIIHFGQIITKNTQLYFDASCQGWKNSTIFNFAGGIKITW